MDNCFSLNPVCVYKKRRFCAEGKPRTFSVFGKLEIGKKRPKYFRECRKREAKINLDCYFLVIILCI